MNKLNICRNITTKTQRFYFKNPFTCYSDEFSHVGSRQACIEYHAGRVNGTQVTHGDGVWTFLSTFKTCQRQEALKGWSTDVDGKKPTFSFGRWMREATLEEKKDPKLRLNAVTQFLKSVR